MPINPSIPLGVEQAPLIQTPEQRLSSQTAQLELGERQRAIRDQQQLRGILTKYNGDFERALPEVRALNPTLALKIEDTINESHARALEYQSRQLTHQKAQVDFYGQLAGSVTDQASLDAMRYTADKAGLDVSQVPRTWDPATSPPLFKAMQDATLTAQQRIAQHEKQLADERAEREATRKEAADAAKARSEEAKEAAAIARQTGLDADRKIDNDRQAATAAAAAARDKQRLGFEGERVGLERQRVGLERQRLGAETMSQASAAVPEVQPGQKNDAFLKTLAPPVATQVKALAEGRMQIPSGAALRSPYWQNLLQAVAKYDPSFDTVNYNARAKTRAAFSSGKEAGQVNALNTVIGHLEGLSQAADALNNSDSPLYNSIANRMSKAMGRPAVTNFDTIKKAVADEVTKVWRQTGGTEADIQSAQANLDAANSPAQIHGAIATYGHLLESKLTSLADQYKQGMGADPINMVTPQSRAALTKLEQATGSGKSPASTPSNVPANVQAALKGQSIGRHTLSDGSVWDLLPNGAIQKAK